MLKNKNDYCNKVNQIDTYLEYDSIILFIK